MPTITKDTWKPAKVDNAYTDIVAELIEDPGPGHTATVTRDDGDPDIKEMIDQARAAARNAEGGPRYIVLKEQDDESFTFYLRGQRPERRKGGASASGGGQPPQGGAGITSDPPSADQAGTTPVAVENGTAVDTSVPATGDSDDLPSTPEGEQASPSAG